MITKVYEIICDACGNTYHSHSPSILHANRYHREIGGIIYKQFHFCSPDCFTVFYTAMGFDVCDAETEDIS